MSKLKNIDVEVYSNEAYPTWVRQEIKAQRENSKSTVQSPPVAREPPQNWFIHCSLFVILVGWLCGIV